MTSVPRLCLAVALVLGNALVVSADPRTSAVRGITDLVVRGFGHELAKDAPELLTARLSRLVLTHGDDVLKATQTIGPHAVPLLEQAGEFAPQAARMLARHGDAALPVVADPRQLALIGRYGDGMAEVLIKHHNIAVPLLTAHPATGTRAWGALSAQNGRRLAILNETGSFRQAAHSEKLLGVIARHGDRAMDFVWRNKGALAVSSVLAAFLADPEPFLSGGRDLSQVVAKSTATPLAGVAERVSQQINWRPALLVVVAVMCCYGLVRRRIVTLRPRIGC